MEIHKFGERQYDVREFVVPILVVLLVILALMHPLLVQKSNRLTVIYLLDQSLSIPSEQRLAMIHLA